MLLGWLIILENVPEVVIWSLVSQVGRCVVSRIKQVVARSAVRLLRVKWSNLEEQAPDSIPPTGQMLRMAPKLTTWVPIDHSQSTSMLAASPDDPVGQVLHRV